MGTLRRRSQCQRQPDDKTSTPGHGDAVIAGAQYPRFSFVAVQFGRLLSQIIISPVCSIPKSLIYLSVTFFSQVRWFAQTSDGASYVTEAGTSTPYHLRKPSFARCIWRSYTGSLPDHPFAPIPFILTLDNGEPSALVAHNLRETYDYTTEFTEPFPGKTDKLLHPGISSILHQAPKQSPIGSGSESRGLELNICIPLQGQPQNEMRKWKIVATP